MSLLSITVNGESRHIAPDATVATLLADMQLVGKRIAVERNGAIVPRSQHDSCLLSDDDRIEIVHAIGGG